MLDKLLTHGNIRKSRCLKYCIYDFSVRESSDEIESYNRYLSGLPFRGLADVYPYLHDADISFSTMGENLVLQFRTDYYERDLGIISGSFNFIGHTLYGYQCLKKTGHIGRYSRPLGSLTFGYDEFYQQNDFYFFTLLMYDKKWPPYKTGYPGVLCTIRFKDLVIESNIG